MPRLPFAPFRSVSASLGSTLLTAAFVAATCGMASQAVAVSPPSASIQIMSASGQAPFAVHVHGLGSQLGAGDETTARYEWTFGDPSGQYNTLVGWNAAHIYDQPGNYTITLRVTNEAGLASTTTRTVTVTPAARSTIYVSPSGSDSNSGSSASSPIRTVARAAQLVAPNRAIVFQRGGWFDTTSTISIGSNNVLIGAYGSGAPPVLNFTSNAWYTAIISSNPDARDVVIEGIRFDAPFTPTKDTVRGVRPRGANVTIRNCEFGNMSYALNTEDGGCMGMLTQNNVAGALGAYYLWLEGSDQTHLGNVVGDSIYEHNYRFAGGSRVLIAHNDLTNTGKSSIWCMTGDHCSIMNNTIRDGRLLGGPNFADNAPSDRFRYIVYEGNNINTDGIILYHGAENVAIRNNVLRCDDVVSISIWGYSSQLNRTVRNVAVYNNTGINHSNQWGAFLKVGESVENVRVANNLYCAPWLNGFNGANVIVEGWNLSSLGFIGDVWANPAIGSRYHVVGSGGVSVSQWSAFGETANESYRSFSTSDLNASWLPQFNARTAQPQPGVHTDYHGNARPASGPWMAGAVEAMPGAGGGGGGGGSGGSADIDGDGRVNVQDLLGVLTAWGACPSNCPADINRDGLVSTIDLLSVISNWN